MTTTELRELEFDDEHPAAGCIGIMAALGLQLGAIAGIFWLLRHWS